jgi:hypothetical protein
VASVECMALEEIAFQYRQWTIIGALRSLVRVVTANILLLLRSSSRD